MGNREGTEREEEEEEDCFPLFFVTQVCITELSGVGPS